MARVLPVEFETLSPEQQRVYKDIAGPRLAFGGPFTVWIRNPDLAEAMNKVGDILRVNGKLEKRILELLILLSAREWNCDYQWAVHDEAAEKAGLSRETIDAIRLRKTPTFTREDEEVVYKFVTELFRDKKVSDASYDRALALFGDDLLVELVTNVGRYTQAAIVVNAFDVPTHKDRHPLTETEK